MSWTCSLWSFRCCSSSLRCCSSSPWHFSRSSAAWKYSRALCLNASISSPWHVRLSPVNENNLFLFFIIIWPKNTFFYQFISHCRNCVLNKIGHDVWICIRMTQNVKQWLSKKQTFNDKLYREKCSKNILKTLTITVNRATHFFFGWNTHIHFENVLD